MDLWSVERGDAGLGRPVALIIGSRSFARLRFGTGAGASEWGDWNAGGGAGLDAPARRCWLAVGTDGMRRPNGRSTRYSGWGSLESFAVGRAACPGTPLLGTRGDGRDAAAKRTFDALHRMGTLGVVGGSAGLIPRHVNAGGRGCGGDPLRARALSDRLRVG